jgi:chemosensory pili system protein ChpA (sensor histidine kinase/response regulator)
MHTCAADLHQVHGTLRMVELYGAAMVVGEMEQLVAALISDRVANRDEAYAALMRGMMQMPDYLERLQSGHRDVPIVLLPLLNDLRASRGEQSLDESALFTPNLDASLPLGAPGAADPAAAEAHRSELPELRARFQQQLLAWFRGQGSDRQLLGMRGTLDSIAARCYTIAGRRLWWIAAGVLEGLERGVLRAHEKEVRQLIGRVDRSIRELVDGGEEAFITLPRPGRAASALMNCARPIAWTGCFRAPPKSNTRAAPCRAITVHCSIRYRPRSRKTCCG